MFNYINISYSEKIIKLLEYFPNSSVLADQLEVRRNSLVRWRENDSGIKEENKLKIDVVYCSTFGFDSIDTIAINNMYDKLSKLSFEYFNLEEEDLIHNISINNAFGSLEIEEVNITKKQFDKVAIDKELIKNIEQRELFSIKNLAALNHKVINDVLECANKPNCKYIVDSREILNYHFGLMSGIRDDAGCYSKYRRIIPGHEDLILTDPRDIPEECERWCDKYKSIKTLKDIAEAHADFELIHPFGDGNGRIGRLLMAIHCIEVGFIPPLINKENKALYYVFLKHAQINNDYSYLSYFIGQSILSMHHKFFKKL